MHRVQPVLPAVVDHDGARPVAEEQWANMQGDETPVRVSDPAQSATFVLVRAEVYERFKSLFEEDPVTEQSGLPWSCRRTF